MRGGADEDVSEADGKAVRRTVMPNTIFYKNDDNRLVPLNETLYEKENYLQMLIKQNPSLLAGEQITPNEPRK